MTLQRPPSNARDELLPARPRYELQYTRGRARHAPAAAGRRAAHRCRSPGAAVAPPPSACYVAAVGRPLIVAAAVAAVALAAAGCSAARDSSGILGPGPGRTAPVGGEVTVGDVTWRVLYMRRTPSVDRQFSGTTRAKGTFVLLQVRAERRSRSGRLDSRALSVVDSRGRIFEVDAQARAAVEDAGLEPLAASRISARVPVEGWVAFDVARNSRGLRLRVEDAERESEDFAFIKLP